MASRSAVVRAPPPRRPGGVCRSPSQTHAHDEGSLRDANHAIQTGNNAAILLPDHMDALVRSGQRTQGIAGPAG